MSKAKKFTKQIGDFFRNQVLAWLRKWVLDWLIKKILGTAIGGVLGWLFTFIFDIAWKKWVVPAYKKAIRKAETEVKRPIYKKKAKAVKDAQTEKDWDASVDDLP